jgi:8-oxo-dGTP diphosphatase
MKNKNNENPNKKIIKVSCGILYNDKNEILISQRSKKSKEYPLRWEFLGGKFEQGETGEQAMIREIKEEIDLDIINPKLFFTKTHSEQHADIYLEFYIIKEWTGKLKKIVHENLVWEKIEKLKEYDLLDGDLEIVAMLEKLDE